MNILNVRVSCLCASNSIFVAKSFLSVSAISFDRNLKKQGKVFEKLLGERKKSGKKWYKNVDQDYHILKFETSGTIRKQDNSKWNNRRINILNKIFMMHITDLMSTGSVAELIQGKDVQIICVKMSKDFTHLNILWTSTVDCLDIDNILHKCAGMLRHELSQLRIVGEVPNIKFMRDKTNENLTKISKLLENLNIDDTSSVDNNLNNTLEELQNLSMTQDIFCLDRQMIVNNIRSKLKKSADAWEIHKTK